MRLDKQALLLAQTHFHSLGEPRNFQLSQDGAYLYFTRSENGISNTHALWRLHIQSGDEEIVFDPRGRQPESNLTAEEEKQRERLRETSTGITSYVLARNDKYVSFAYNGRLWLTDTSTLKSSVFRYVTGAFDPRFNGDSEQIGYVDGQGLWYIGLNPDARPISIAKNNSAHVYWGRAEFVASEEFARYRGYWWAPSGTRLVVSRVDETKVRTAYLYSSDPWSQPSPLKYPAAGTANADTSLFICETGSSAHTEITWDKTKWPYVTHVQWNKSGLYVTVQSRDQRRLQVYSVSQTGVTEIVYTESDNFWIDIVQPLPLATETGHFVGLRISDKRRLTYDGQTVSPAEHHVDDFLGITGDWLVYTASPDPKERTIFAVNVKTGAIKPLSSAGGLYSGFVTSNRVFVSGAKMNTAKKTRYLFEDPEKQPVALTVRSYSTAPSTLPNPIFFTVGPDNIEASLVLPAKFDKKQKLPVLLQVYGGPGHQEVLYSRRSYLEAQWWADQGYAVLSADGPGTPGRDTGWERRIKHDLITEPAGAQIEVLNHAFHTYPFLDKSRVAVRGWSFGGYLSAYLSVRYPDMIQASISGAPVTDWSLYDTHYTERYLDDPDDNDIAYRKSSLLVAAANAKRPILLIHGLGDDNVLFANSLQLVEVLSAAHSPYQFVPLSGASHFMKHAEQQAWLLGMERDFLASKMPKYPN